MQNPIKVMEAIPATSTRGRPLRIGDKVVVKTYLKGEEVFVVTTSTHLREYAHSSSKFDLNAILVQITKPVEVSLHIWGNVWQVAVEGIEIEFPPATSRRAAIPPFSGEIHEAFLTLYAVPYAELEDEIYQVMKDQNAI